YVEERAAPSFEAVRQLLHKMLHPERNVAEHRLVGPAGGCRLGQRLETKAAHRTPERMPGLAHLRQKLGRPLLDRREDLVEMLGVVAVCVSGDDGDRPIVVLVDELR